MNGIEAKIKLIFDDYRKILVPLLLILASFLIILLVILPQFSAIFEKLNTISAQNKQIQTLESSKSTVAATNQTQVNENYDVATRALPTEKDVALIFDGLTQAASKSNTNIDSFSISVGGIFGRAANEVSSETVPAVDVTADVSGTAGDLVNFTKELEEAFPISEIDKIAISGNSGVFAIKFFYRPVNAAQIAKQDLVKPLTQGENDTLNQLKKWDED